MSLDKIDLIDRKFTTSLLGYNREEVNGLVAEAAETIGQLAEEKMALGRSLEELRREVAGYQSREATLRDTLLTTQTIVEDVKAKAKREAETLLDTARDQAAALVREAEQRAACLDAEIDLLQKRKTALTTRFREMLLAALDVVDADQTEEAAEAAPALVAPEEGEGGLEEEDNAVPEEAATDEEPEPESEGTA